MLAVQTGDGEMTVRLEPVRDEAGADGKLFVVEIRWNAVTTTV